MLFYASKLCTSRIWTTSASHPYFIFLIFDFLFLSRQNLWGVWFHLWICTWGSSEEIDITSGSNINTHYYNSNLIWRTVSRGVDEVIPSDHRRRSVEGDPMEWPHPRDVIYCTPDQVTIKMICLLYTFFLTLF